MKKSKNLAKNPLKSRKVGRPSKLIGDLSRPTDQGETGDIKGKILEAYFEICQHEGIETVTLQKVADKSGVALTTVRYHFQMKGLSLSQVAQEYVADKTYQFLDAGMLNARNKEGYDPVQAYIETTFSWIAAEPIQASFLIYFYYVSSTQVPVAIGNQELVEIAQRRILGLVHEGLGMKLYNFVGDAKEVSAQIHTLVMGGCLIAATSRNAEFARLQKETCQKWAFELLKAM